MNLPCDSQKKTADVYVDNLVAAYGDLDRAREEIRRVSAERDERDKFIAELQEEVAYKNQRIDELERLFEEHCAALKHHLHEVEEALSHSQLEALELAQHAFLDLIDKIESCPDECWESPPPLSPPPEPSRKRKATTSTPPEDPGEPEALEDPDGTLEAPSVTPSGGAAAIATSASSSAPTPSAPGDQPSAPKRGEENVIRLENLGRMKTA